MPQLQDPQFWTAPGYRSITIVATDDKGAKYLINVDPAQLRRLIGACADAASQIGIDPPIDWADFPFQITWPAVRPWKRGAAEKPSAGIAQQQSAVPALQAPVPRSQVTSAAPRSNHNREGA